MTDPHTPQHVLLDKIEQLQREIKRLSECLRKKNLELGALHYVWCSGCESGTHRWSQDHIDEALVRMAERNTQRLRQWLDAKKARDEQ